MKSVLLLCSSLLILGSLSSASSMIDEELRGITASGVFSHPDLEADPVTHTYIWVWDEETQSWIKVPVENPT